MTGRRVDAEKGCVLKAEMARKNLHTKRGLHYGRRSVYEAFYSVPDQQHERLGLLDHVLPPSPSTSTQLSINTNSNPASPPPTSSSALTGLMMSNGLPSPPGITSPVRQSILGTLDQHPPCNTLYVGNLPFNANEDELRAMFMQSTGFRRLCFKPKVNSSPMCFVEFEDVACATQTLYEYNGVLLSNSVKGGIRLSFSKNPLVSREGHWWQYKDADTLMIIGCSSIRHNASWKHSLLAFWYIVMKNKPYHFHHTTHTSLKQTDTYIIPITYHPLQTPTHTTTAIIIIYIHICRSISLLVKQ